MNDRPRVLVKEKIGDSGLELLREAGFDVEVGVDWPDDELERRIGEFDGILIRSATKLNADLLEKADRLRAIGRAGVGVDNVDVDAATKRGIVVANAPQSNVITAAEHTMAMLLALARNVPQAQKQAVYDAYGIPGHKTGDYEIDHLVPLALGGSNHSSNLWPQPATGDKGGYHEKDIVEVYLYQQVRDGKMALPDAQRAVVNNWREVYAGLSPAQRASLAKNLSGLSPEEQAVLTN